jgi:hypothetical protein
VDAAVATTYRALDPATAKMFVSTKGLQAVGANVTALLAAAAAGPTLTTTPSTTKPTASTPTTATTTTTAGGSTPSTAKTTDTGVPGSGGSGSNVTTLQSRNAAGRLAAGLTGVAAAVSAALLLL